MLPTIGLLYPEGLEKLAKADDVDQVKQVLDNYQEYRPFMDQNVGNDKSLEDKFFEHEVFLNKDGFMQQFHVGPRELASRIFRLTHECDCSTVCFTAT